MTKHLLILSFIVSFASSFADNPQKTKVVKTYYQKMTKKGDLKDDGLKEEYEVLKDYESVKNGFYRKYSENKALEEEGTYSNNKKNGLWLFYYNNKLQKEVNYKDDIETGELKEYDLDGRLVSTSLLNDYGHLDGDFKIYNTDNLCITSGKFRNNMLDGVVSYYYDNGNIRCRINFKDDIAIDTARSFYPNGSKMAFKTFVNGYTQTVEGFYEDGKRLYRAILLDTVDFKYKKEYFYENGNIKAISVENDSILFEIQNYSSSGIKLDNGNYINGDGTLKSYNNDTLVSEISFNNYMKDGLAIYYYSNGNKKESVFYKNDKITSDWYNYNADGSLDYIGKKKINDYAASFDKEIDYTDIKATYRGGVKELMKYLAKNIRYPSLARENGLEGKVIIKFSVKKFGNLSEIKVLKDGVGGGCAEESIRVIKNMPLWYPAFTFGFPNKMFFTLPITFKLQ